MSAPTTANEVVIALSRLATELRTTVTAFREAELDAAEKRHRADMVESRAFLNCDGPMDIRKHTAKVAAETEEAEALVAEAIVRIVRADMRALETRIEIGRSYNAALRAELNTLGSMPS